MMRLTRRSCLTLGVVVGVRPLIFAQPDSVPNPVPRPPGRAAEPIDRCVAATAGWRGPADAPRLWEPFCRFVGLLSDATGRPIPRAFWAADDLLGAAQFPPTYACEPYTAPLRQPGSLFARPTVVVAPEVTIPGPVRQSLIVSRGSVRGKDVTDSVVIANGDVEIDQTDRALVIADGRVSLRGAARYSIIISRQHLTLFLPVRSTVAAGGRVLLTHPDPRRALGREETVLEGDVNPFGVVRFTSAADLGVDAVSEFAGTVRVAASVPGGLFARGAFHRGDELLRVGDVPVASADDFRRLVRDAAAVRREVVVSARRDGRPFAVRVGPAA